MGTVVALDHFRHLREECVDAPGFRTPKRPRIVGSQIWGADYTSADGIVFGLLKVREIASYYFGTYDEEFDQLLMEALEKAYYHDLLGHEKLVRAIAPLKEILAEMINDDNRKPLSIGLVVLDLMEKAPVHVRK